LEEQINLCYEHRTISEGLSKKVKELEDIVFRQNEALDKSIEQEISELTVTDAVNLISKMQAQVSGKIREEIYKTENKLGLLNLDLETLELNSENVSRRIVYKRN